LDRKGNPRRGDTGIWGGVMSILSKAIFSKTGVLEKSLCTEEFFMRKKGDTSCGDFRNVTVTLRLRNLTFHKIP
jgi:hypothetical protein